MGDRKRILVIDDNRALASATERILQKQDWCLRAVDPASTLHLASGT